MSLLVLAPTLYALHGRGMAGGWRKVYVIGGTVALYFNFFVLIAQAFQKVPVLKALAPTQTEPPFAIAQGVALVAFIALGVAATSRFREPAVAPL